MDGQARALIRRWLAEPTDENAQAALAAMDNDQEKAMKRVEEMTIEECQEELLYNIECFRDYARNGEGISSKEHVRHRCLEFKVRMAELISPEAAMRVDDIPSFIVQGQKMFAVED